MNQPSFSSIKLPPSYSSPLNNNQLGEKHNSVKGNLILGNAKYGCQGAGICRISAKNSHQLNHCKCSKIPIQLIRINSTTLQLNIKKDIFSLVKKEEHYSNKKIELSKRLILPKQLSESLGFRDRLVIFPGHYLLYQNEKYFYHYLDYSIEVESNSKKRSM